MKKNIRPADASPTEDASSLARRTQFFTAALNRIPPEKRRAYMRIHGFDFLARGARPGAPARDPRDEPDAFPR